MHARLTPHRRKKNVKGKHQVQGAKGNKPGSQKNNTMQKELQAGQSKNITIKMEPETRLCIKK